MKKKNLKVHFSSKSDEWSTPQELFDELDAEYDFEWDAAASYKNSKIGSCFFNNILPGCSGMDALATDWIAIAERFWLNPPYSQCKEFIKKAYEESQKGCTVVCLIPSRTDTRYWHDFVMKAFKIEFIKGRLKFGDSKNSAPFPSAVVVFKPGNHTPIIETRVLGKKEKFKKDIKRLLK